LNFKFTTQYEAVIIIKTQGSVSVCANMSIHRLLKRSLEPMMTRKWNEMGFWGVRFASGRKKSSGHRPVHMAQRPAAEYDIDFGELELSFPVDESKEFVVPTRGWAPPPTVLPDLPFAVKRTTHTEGVPVYTDYKAGRTKVVTILRRCYGDIGLLRSEMEKVVDGNEVRVRPGRLEVDGNYEKRIKNWLIKIGF